MRVYLLRHADAAPGYPDETRPLTSKGAGQMHMLASMLSPSLFSDVEAVWHSPYERARHTAQLACELFKINKPLTANRDLEPGSEVEPLAKKLSSLPISVLLVGHNPSMEFLASYLLTGQYALPAMRFKKAAIMCLDRTLDSRQPWLLEGFLIPNWLKSLA